VWNDPFGENILKSLKCGIEVKMKTYKCIKNLSLDKYDEDGFCVEGEQTVIVVGAVFREEKLQYNIVASNDAIHLESENHVWCELYPDTIAEYFEEQKGC
jgi:hypothetical protein